MNVEKLYTDLYTYSQMLEQGEAAFIARQVSNGEKISTPTIAPSILGNILIDLHNEMANNAAKTNGTKALYGLVKAIDKRRMKCSSPPPLTYADGFIYVCDGYMLVKCPESALPKILGTTDNKEWTEKYNRLIGDNIVKATDKIETPSLSEVKAYVSTKKAEFAALHVGVKKKPMFMAKWSLGSAYVNAEYLADFLAAMPEARFYCNNSNKLGGIYIQDGEIEALLLPINV